MTSDSLGVPVEFVTFATNILVALLLGAVMGLERQLRHRAAGLRVTALVCLGAALFVSLSSLIVRDNSPTRIAAQVVCGIGFLGGGVIMREGFNVRGMTTAAALWCSAAVGSLAGAGFLTEAALGALGVVAVNLGLRPVARWIDARSHSYSDVETTYRVRVTCTRAVETRVRETIAERVHALKRQHVQTMSVDETAEGRLTVAAEILSGQRNDTCIWELVELLRALPGVAAVSWERRTMLG
jgi:putative Mg2+ transporter-C (MgtC) family protein